MTRVEFLREQTVSAANKCRRTPMPHMSVSDLPCSLFERKARALKMIFDTMPIYIGPKELIVGTRTYYAANPGNEDGHDRFDYGISAGVKYVNAEDIERFGCDQSYCNKTHATPDFGIILQKGIGGILAEIEQKRLDPSLHSVNIESLAAMHIAYSGLSGLILRYEAEALAQAETAKGEAKVELVEIARICRKLSLEKPETFREAVQLFWFAHLGTMIESFMFINYGRLDVLFGDFLGDTPRDEALEIIQCLLLKMYDQTDLKCPYLGKYAAQLVLTLGGVLPNGESAVNEVTMLFLEALDFTRLTEPEVNLRLHSKNPPEFLDKAAELTVSGCNFVSYYNDDLFIESLTRAGIPLEYARSYGFDLCQDINIPGKGEFFVCNMFAIINDLLRMLDEKRDYETFDELIAEFKTRMANVIDGGVKWHNNAEELVDLYAQGRLDEYFDKVKNEGRAPDRIGCSPMAPLPFMSGLYHGCVENALDVIFRPYPIKDTGSALFTTTETVNSLAAIKKVVFDEKLYTLEEVYAAYKSNFEGEKNQEIRSVLWNSPKWGNDDDYVDLIAKDVLEFCLLEFRKHKTYFGGAILGGIHTPHPVPTGQGIPATPDGKYAGVPVAVSTTPHNGTAKCGPTATLMSTLKLDPMLIHWNYCVMINYFSSVFDGNGGADTFKSLLNSYFKAGGLQHQPNITNVEDLKRAQIEPEKYKDIIVRLWGVSAHFVDLPRVLQDEMIARFS